MLEDLARMAGPEAEVVELCSGVTYKGEAFHAFIKMTFSQYEDYLKRVAADDLIDLNACGTIIHSGWGEKPTHEVAERLMRDHTDNLKILEAIAKEDAALHDIIRKNSREGA